MYARVCLSFFRANTVVMGVGYPTLVAANGNCQPALYFPALIAIYFQLDFPELLHFLITAVACRAPLHCGRRRGRSAPVRHPLPGEHSVMQPAYSYLTVCSIMDCLFRPETNLQVLCSSGALALTPATRSHPGNRGLTLVLYSSRAL